MTNNKRSTTAMAWLATVLIVSSAGFNGYLFVELNDKKEEVEQVQKDLKTTKDDVEKVNAELGKISEENEKLSAEKDEHIKQIDELNKSVKQKEVEKAEKDSIINQKDSEISDLQAKKEDNKKLAVNNRTSEKPLVTNTSVEPEVVEEEANVEENPVETTANGRQLTVEATMYGAVDGSQSGVTATGIDVRGTSTYNGMIIVAVDPSVIPLWSIIDIEGYGQAIALDTGGMIKGHKMDILTSSNQEAMNFGRKPINITIVREGK